MLAPTDGLSRSVGTPVPGCPFMIGRWLATPSRYSLFTKEACREHIYVLRRTEKAVPYGENAGDRSPVPQATEQSPLRILTIAFHILRQHLLCLVRTALRECSRLWRFRNEEVDLSKLLQRCFVLIFYKAKQPLLQTLWIYLLKCCLI